MVCLVHGTCLLAAPWCTSPSNPERSKRVVGEVHPFLQDYCFLGVLAAQASTLGSIELGSPFSIPSTTCFDLCILILGWALTKHFFFPSKEFTKTDDTRAQINLAGMPLFGCGRYSLPSLLAKMLDSQINAMLQDHIKNTLFSISRPCPSTFTNQFLQQVSAVDSDEYCLH